MKNNKVDKIKNEKELVNFAKELFQEEGWKNEVLSKSFGIFPKANFEFSDDALKIQNILNSSKTDLEKLQLISIIKVQSKEDDLNKLFIYIVNEAKNYSSVKLYCDINDINEKTTIDELKKIRDEILERDKTLLLLFSQKVKKTNFDALKIDSKTSLVFQRMETGHVKLTIKNNKILEELLSLWLIPQEINSKFIDEKISQYNEIFKNENGKYVTPIVDEDGGFLFPTYSAKNGEMCIFGVARDIACLFNKVNVNYLESVQWYKNSDQKNNLYFQDNLKVGESIQINGQGEYFVLESDGSIKEPNLLDSPKKIKI